MDHRTDSASSILRLVEASRQARWEQARKPFVFVTPAPFEISL
jgi:hypothetical protein